MDEIISHAQASSSFRSLLYSDGQAPVRQGFEDMRAQFQDLFLDRIFEAAYGSLAPPRKSPYDRQVPSNDEPWRSEVLENLRNVFASPSCDAALARARQNVARDLARDDIATLMRRFQAAMAVMREGKRRARKAWNRIEGQGWFLDAVQVYCRALEDLQAGLESVRPQAGPLGRLLADVASHRETSNHADLCQGLDAVLPQAGPLDQLLADLASYREAADHVALCQGVDRLRSTLNEVRYAVRIEGDQVTVLGDPSSEDFRSVVERTFARFRRGAVRDYRCSFGTNEWMSHVEAQIVDRVALLYPDLFGRIQSFCAEHEEFADERWLRLDRELPFFLLWSDFLRRAAKVGVKSCLPKLVDPACDTEVSDACDLALVNQALGSERCLVGNDFRLQGAERMIVVTGPNHGGKTTLARVFGQIHHIAGLGLAVPARSASLSLPDRIFTHFERSEDIATQRGKLQDDLVRMRSILDAASPRSVIVMNEVFSSTSLEDAVWLGRRMMERVRELGCRCLFVTFLDELASFDSDTVSMVATVDPGDPTVRTYKVIRKPADGKAYARALASKYRVTREWLLRRIAS